MNTFELLATIVVVYLIAVSAIWLFTCDRIRDFLFERNAYDVIAEFADAELGKINELLSQHDKHLEMVNDEGANPSEVELLTVDQERYLLMAKTSFEVYIETGHMDSYHEAVIHYGNYCGTIN